MIEFDPTLVHDWLSRSARRFPEKEALIFGNQRWKYKTLEQYSNHLAIALKSAGIQRQDRVVIFLNNCSESVISIYGILKAGAIFVILDGSIKHQKLNQILKNSSAKMIITHPQKMKVVDRALKNLDNECQVLWVGSKEHIPGSSSLRMLSWEDIFSNVEKRSVDTESPDSTTLHQSIDVDLAALIYTSGSTGQPKGIMSTHHNMISAARSIIQYLNNSDDDIIFNVLPLSFDYGLYQVIMTFMFGGTIILQDSFLYMHSMLGKISQEKATGFPVVPTILRLLLRMENLSNYDFSTLKYITNTGDSLNEGDIQEFRYLFPHIKIFSMYGLTECKRVSYMLPEKLDKYPSSVGKAMPNCEVLIVDKNGNEVKPNEKGELIIRGSNVMQGYWNDHELTKLSYKVQNYADNRILHSGDYFKKDENEYLYFFGRKNDMIKSRGERISAKEIESTLSSMPGVAEVAVIGIPDEILGQAIKVFFVPESGVKMTEKEVIKFCSLNLETFAIPKYVVINSFLPKTSNGKIDKKQLKAQQGC